MTFFRHFVFSQTIRCENKNSIFKDRLNRPGTIINRTSENVKYLYQYLRFELDTAILSDFAKMPYLMSFRHFQFLHFLFVLFILWFNILILCWLAGANDELYFLKLNPQSRLLINLIVLIYLAQTFINKNWSQAPI